MLDTINMIIAFVVVIIPSSIHNTKRTAPRTYAQGALSLKLFILLLSRCFRLLTAFHAGALVILPLSQIRENTSLSTITLKAL